MSGPGLQGLAVVTGAGQGIGREIALHLLQEGCQVLAIGRSVEKLQTLARDSAADDKQLFLQAQDIRDTAALKTALARAEDAAGLEALLFAETPTLGIRRRAMERSVLPRRHEEVSTPWGTVRMKVRGAPSGDAATPEYEDCAAIAAARNIPVRAVIEAALVAWEAQRKA